MTGTLSWCAGRHTRAGLNGERRTKAGSLSRRRRRRRQNLRNDNNANNKAPPAKRSRRLAARKTRLTRHCLSLIRLDHSPVAGSAKQNQHRAWLA